MQRALERVRALSASNARQLASSRAPSSAARIARTSYDLGLSLEELGCPDEAAAELERARGVLEFLRAASLEREVVDAQAGPRGGQRARRDVPPLGIDPTTGMSVGRPPAGLYRINVIHRSGQTWSFPNELSRAMGDALAGTQGRYLTVVE